MRAEAISARALSPAIEARWRALHRMQGPAASPFLSPEFSRLMAQVRPRVEVGVIFEGANASGFMPFERGRFSIGRPAGGALSDLQGAILRPGASPPWAHVLQGCGLHALAYERVACGNDPWEAFHIRRQPTYSVDLPNGYLHYVRERRQAGGRIFAKLAALRRRFARDVASLRFEPYCAEEGALATLMTWKRQRYAARGYQDLYALPWAREALRLFHGHGGIDFRGALSVLYAGDEMAAAILSLESPTQWHCWIPAFNPRFSAYSPGMVLLVEVMEHASARGLKRIELGGGEFGYKRRLQNLSLPVAAGVVDRHAAIAAGVRWLDGRKGSLRRAALRIGSVAWLARRGSGSAA